MAVENAYLHVHRDGLPIGVIAEIFHGVRIDIEPGMSHADAAALIAHYTHDNLLQVKAVVHDVDTAIWLKRAWPKMDVQFLIEPNLVGMDWSPPKDYTARLMYMAARAVHISGPSTSNLKEVDLSSLQGQWGYFDSVVAHGYGYQPEELPQWFSTLRKFTNRRLWVGEYSSVVPIWEDKERADYHARSIKCCPCDIVIYRAQHQADGPGYFELVNGQWKTRPAWDYLKRALASIEVT